MRTKVLIVYTIAMLLGVFTGVVGAFFQIAIEKLRELSLFIISSLSTQGISANIVSAFLSMILAIAAWLMVRRFAPEASGSGVQEIEGALEHVRLVYWRRLLPVKFIAGVMAIGGQLVLGREGPTIQMGGNMGAMLAEWMKLGSGRRDTMIAAGAAAGLATAFNAPLAGVLFIVEEMRNEFNFNFTNFKMVAISCVMATIVVQFILGSGPAIPMSVFAQPSLKSLWIFFFFGLAAGFAGLLFNKLLIFSLSLTENFSQKQALLYVAFVGALIGVLAVNYPEIVGGGYVIIHEALELSPGFAMLLLLFPVRLLTTMLCYTTRVPGGIFAPLLALGTLFGLAGYHVLIKLIPDMTIHPGMLAVAGMGALFSAAVRAPLTGIVLVVEMTQNYSLILPLMVSCLTSTTVVQLAKNAPVYSQLLRRTLRISRQSLRS